MFKYETDAVTYNVARGYACVIKPHRVSLPRLKIDYFFGDWCFIDENSS